MTIYDAGIYGILQMIERAFPVRNRLAGPLPTDVGVKAVAGYKHCLWSSGSDTALDECTSLVLSLQFQIRNRKAKIVKP
jgi:hypothetical protein